MFHSDLNNLIKGLHTWNISISIAVKYYNWNIYPLVKKVNSKSLKQELCSKSWRFNLKNVIFYCIVALFCYKDWVVSKLGWPTLFYSTVWKLGPCLLFSHFDYQGSSAYWRNPFTHQKAVKWIKVDLLLSKKKVEWFWLSG